jgi:hypothetical protein
MQAAKAMAKVRLTDFSWGILLNMVSLFYNAAIRVASESGVFHKNG